MGMERRWSTRTRQGLLMMAVAIVPLLLVATPAVASATVTGPVTGGSGAVVLQGTSFDLKSVGYTQSEYFLSGTANAYAPTTPLGSDGHWSVAPASTASYTTRMVVDRPANPARFNGTVVVEWLNVTAGADTAAEWIYGHTQLIRDGYAWVGVSAQQTGVQALQAADPVRYASLSHPGDSYSYDIFSQAGQTVRTSAAQVLGGLAPRTVLASGESQSAFRLTTYINAIQPLAHKYDGFLVHSREGTAAPLSEAPQTAFNAPSVVFLRSDTGVPVLDVQTETDLLSPLLNYLPARQADSSHFRLWEAAGTAHADIYETNFGAGDTGNGATDVQEFNSMLNPSNATPAFSCNAPFNTGEEHYVIDAAETALNRWVTTGIPPATAPRMQVNTSGSAPVFVTDADGNVLGGVRTPAVDVPVATLSGLGNSGVGQFGFFCSLLGTTTPFSAAKLAARYPTHSQFVSAWTTDTIRNQVAGFITPADAAQLINAATKSTVGN